MSHPSLDQSRPYSGFSAHPTDFGGAQPGFPVLSHSDSAPGHRGGFHDRPRAGFTVFGKFKF